MKLPFKSVAAVAALAMAGLLSAGAVHAADGVLDVSGVDSFFEIGEGNTVLYADVAPFAQIVAISWNVEITSHDPSWLSEVSFAATDLGLAGGVVVTLGEGDDFSGTKQYTGRFDLLASGQSFQVGDDGVVRVEFFEYFNDLEVGPDSSWNYGTLTFEVAAVPEPGTGLMALLGAGALVALHRRRRPAALRDGGVQ